MREMGVEFRMLGPLEVVVDGDAVPLGGPKQRALLALLLLNANEVVSTDRALEALWPAAEPGAATRSLQVYVSSARKALGAAAEALETRPGGYVLTVAEDELDAARFERLAQEGRRAREAGEAARAAAAFREALALWRGPALADLRYEELAQRDVDRLEELRLTTVEERVDADLALGRHAELVAEIEALVAQHPLRERLRGQLMLALYRSGRQADALAAYQEARRVLADELGLDPGAELRELERAILRHDPSLDIEPAELQARRRLPAPATPLVGRRREVDELTELVRGEARLVTLTGPGGTGKTRVALQAAYELADAFPQGVVFVGLAALRDPELVPAEIAGALGLEAGARTAGEALAEHLRERTALLVIDNFEQVDAAAPELGRLLGAASGLRLLVTSRHPLRLYGEHELPVPPLPEDDAVALFVARARAVKPDFRSSPAVAELCAYVDRLPLAIELVAGRVRELSPPEMLRTLPPRLELAAHGPRDVPERQQTLWATIGWSHDLLSAAEQGAFAQLAVFAGGCTLEAAREVCGADPELVRDLVEKNLLYEHGERVAVLETVREYALERLDARGETTATSRRHANHFLELVLAGADLRGDPREWEWMDRLEADRENVGAALDFWLEHDAEHAARLADGAYRYWYTRGHFEEGLRAFERVVERGELLPARERVRALNLTAAFAFGRRDLERALTLAEEALDGQRLLGELGAIARALVLVGTIRSEQNDHEESIRALEESVDVARRHSDPVVLNFALSHLVRAVLCAGMYERTRELGEEALPLMQEADAAESRFTVLVNLGIAALHGGDYAEAAERLAEALALAAERGDPVSMLENVEAIAAVAAAAGEPTLAARLLGAAEALEEARDVRLEAISFALRDTAMQTLLSALGERELLAHHSAGRSLTLEAATELATEVAARISGGSSG